MDRGCVLMTGATGFVGAEVVKQVSSMLHWEIMVLVRKHSATLPISTQQVVVHDFLLKPDSLDVLSKVNVLIHMAARVHMMEDSSNSSLAKFRKMNVEGTLSLARQAAAAGVKRFVFISSVKVNGESTTGKQPFSPSDTYIPNDPYGLSKYEAEQELLKLAKKSDMEVVIIRPPLVYGRGVKANFLKMVQWVGKGIPLPFGSIHNQRSLVALDNLVDFIILCATHPKAVGEVFLISDGEDVSTTELLQKVGKAMGKKTRLIPVPVGLMTLAARLVGKEDVANRLFGSLQVDSSKARELLGWKPVITMDEQLKKMMEAKQ